MNNDHGANNGPMGGGSHNPVVDGGTLGRQLSKPDSPAGTWKTTPAGHKMSSQSGGVDGGKQMPKYDSAQLDKAAHEALNAILATSIEERKEYGGMLYIEKGRCLAMPARSQGEPNKVDVGQYEPNCGCPDGTTPVAYYHTHPTYSVAGFKGDYNKMSDEDKNVAKDQDLDAAYLGTLDGSFYKYDCKQDKTIKFPGMLKNTSE